MVDTRFSMSVQIMMSLAYHGEELMNSEQLAKSIKTNATFVRKLVSRLVEAGLVQSFRGKAGGIKLAKSPSDISLKDIYLASTCEKTLITCHKKPVNKNCPVSGCIEEVIGEIVDGIEETTKKYLLHKKLDQLMKKVS